MKPTLRAGYRNVTTRRESIVRGVLKSWARVLVTVTRGHVQRIAAAYGIRVERSLTASGPHPLVIDGPLSDALNNIPRSAYFNTRSGSIRIGADTVFGEDVMVLTGRHADISDVDRGARRLHDVPPDGRNVTIGRGCYVASRAIIIGPVVIGDNAVVGAGAVVTRNVPDRAFVAGVPARRVRDL